MPHQNVSSSDATAQNAATDRDQPKDPGREASAVAPEEPKSYAASDVKDASLAPPAAGEIADAMEEGDDLEGAAAQQGRTHANRPGKTEAQAGQGPKTVEGNRQRLRNGDAG